MKKEDIKAIEYAKALMKHCEKHENCKGCVLRAGNGSCILENCLAEDWKLPRLKTYKQDFLSKFPNANFETNNICRKMIYGEEHDCRGKTCQECWDEVYMEK